MLTVSVWPEVPRTSPVTVVLLTRAVIVFGGPALRTTLAGARPLPPEHIQVTPTLPRGGDGAVRREILQLIAMNQVDLIDPLLHDAAERDLVGAICEQRKNLRDRFNFDGRVT